MKTSADSLASVMIARFRRHSRIGPRGKLTGPVAELPQPISDWLLRSAGLLTDEIPVLASVFSDSDWLFMSTSRIVLRTEQGIDTIRNAEVTAVSVDLDACACDGEFETYQFSHLLIKTRSGRQAAVRIERGAGFLGVVSVVFMFADRNSREAEAT